MAKLIYTAIGSLDGYVADESGTWGWAAPDEQVHAHVNDAERGIGTYLLGRRMYDVLAFWETYDDAADPSPQMADYAAIWHGLDKVVYSRTLAEPRSGRTRIEREWDAERVRAWKAEADRDLSVGGPELAALALRAGLVDEIRLYLYPVVVGGGTAALPDTRLDLHLLDEHRFENGAVYLHYALSPAAT
jgi:dihydrofolate reductase